MAQRHAQHSSFAAVAARGDEQGAFTIRIPPSQSRTRALPSNHGLPNRGIWPDKPSSNRPSKSSQSSKPYSTDASYGQRRVAGSFPATSGLPSASVLPPKAGSSQVIAHNLAQVDRLRHKLAQAIKNRERERRAREAEQRARASSSSMDYDDELEYVSGPEDVASYQEDAEIKDLANKLMMLKNLPAGPNVSMEIDGDRELLAAHALLDLRYA